MTEKKIYESQKDIPDEAIKEALKDCDLVEFEITYQSFFLKNINQPVPLNRVLSIVVKNQIKTYAHFSKDYEIQHLANILNKSVKVIKYSNDGYEDFWNDLGTIKPTKITEEGGK